MAVAPKTFSLVRWLVVLEIGIWRSLLLWALRRVPGLGPGVQSFGYARDITPLLGAFVFVSALEVIVVHLLLPWETARLVALGIGIWGLLWMVGFLASMRVFRHLLDDDGLRIRSGTTADIRIPWQAVERVTARRGSVPKGRSVQVQDGVAHFAVLKQAKVAVVLHRPTPVTLPDGIHEISELRFYADDPRAFVAAARARLAGVRPVDGYSAATSHQYAG
jgi:hypothetical protein